MTRFAIIILSSVSLCLCTMCNWNTTYIGIQSEDSSVVRAISLDTQKLKSCVPYKDTVCSNGIYLKYIVEKDHYSISIGNRDLDTVLKFRFDCATPTNVVPYFLGANDFMCITSRPCGSFCAVYSVYTFDPDAVIDHGLYYRPVAIDWVDNRIAFLGDAVDSVYIENIKSGEKCGFELNRNSDYESISGAAFDGGKLIIKYFDGQVININAKGKCN